MILLDAIANPGNSGGPVIDVDGCVVGALTLGINLQQSYTAAVTADDIRKFLKPHLDQGAALSDVSASAAQASAMKWEDVVEGSAASTFQILVLGAPQPAAWVDSKPSPDEEEDEPKRPVGWNGLEDPWCMHCNGVGHLRCPERKCKSGVIVGRKRVEMDTPQGVVYTYIPDRKPCGTCGGTARVSCPHCDDGFDPKVKARH